MLLFFGCFSAKQSDGHNINNYFALCNMYLKLLLLIWASVSTGWVSGATQRIHINYIGQLFAIRFDFIVIRCFFCDKINRHFENRNEFPSSSETSSLHLMCTDLYPIVFSQFKRASGPIKHIHIKCNKDSTFSPLWRFIPTQIKSIEMQSVKRKTENSDRGKKNRQ